MLNSDTLGVYQSSCLGDPIYMYKLTPQNKAILIAHKKAIGLLITCKDMT